MDELLRRLLEVLEAEAASYGAFAGRLPLKLEMLKGQRVDRLEKLTEREVQDVEQLRRLDARRRQVVRELATHFPQDPPRTLSALIERVPTAWRDRLSVVRSRLVAAVDALRTGHGACEGVIRRQLEYLDYSLRLLSETAIPAEVTYGPGEAAIPQGVRLLDRRA